MRPRIRSLLVVMVVMVVVVMVVVVMMVVVAAAVVITLPVFHFVFSCLFRHRKEKRRG